MKFIKLVKLFKDAPLQDLHYLFQNGEVNLVRLARIFRVNRRAVMEYRRHGYITFIKRGNRWMATSSEIFAFTLRVRATVSMTQASRIMKIGYSRLKRLVSQGKIRPDYIFGRMHRFRKRRLREIVEINRQLLFKENQRKSKRSKAKPGKAEYSLIEVASIFKVTLQAVRRWVSMGLLKIHERKHRQYANKINVQILAETLIELQSAHKSTKTAARAYLETIAAG